MPAPTSANDSTRDPEQLAAALRAGDRRALGRAITLVESSRADDREPANRLLEVLTPLAGKSIRIGISGVPGVGKSTFIESFGNHLIDKGHKVADVWKPPSMPTTIVVDKKGIIRHIHTGYHDGEEATLEKEIKALF